MWWRVNTYLGQDYTGILCSPYNFSRGLKSFQKKKILTVSIQRLSDFTFTFHFHALEKEMATHPSVLAWRIPGLGEPGGLPSMGSHRVEHDWSDLAAAAAASVKLQCLISSNVLCSVKLTNRFGDPNQTGKEENQVSCVSRKSPECWCPCSNPTDRHCCNLDKCLELTSIQ